MHLSLVSAAVSDRSLRIIVQSLTGGKRCSKESMMTLTQLYFAMGCFPWALHYSSTLYGYLVVVAVYAALGFGVCKVTATRHCL